MGEVNNFNTRALLTFPREIENDYRMRVETARLPSLDVTLFLLQIFTFVNEIFTVRRGLGSSIAASLSSPVLLHLERSSF